MHKRYVLIAAAILVVASVPLFTTGIPMSLYFRPPAAIFPGNHAFVHETGLHTYGGWNAFYHEHAPGYLVAGMLSSGELLAPGNYRYDFFFTLRSGHFVSLLSDANDVVRLEAYDATARDVILERTLQIADFKGVMRGPIRKSLFFSTLGRDGHRIEPRIYWQGLSGIYLTRVERIDMPAVSAAALIEKAESFEKMMHDFFLERGFVVVRDPEARAQDTADAAIWTGLYAAAEAWRYNLTRDPKALARLEDSLWALHALCKAAPIHGMVARYVEPSGASLPEAPSKDTYTGFFYGVARGYPYVKDPALKRALQRDLASVAGHFLDHDLKFVSPYDVSVDLNPYLGAGFVSEASRSLRGDAGLRRGLIKTFRLMRWYFWLHRQKAPPALDQAIVALRHPDTARYEDDLLPLATGLRQALKEIQHNVHESALRGPKQGLTGTPYAKLDLLLLKALHNLDADTGGRPFSSLEDLRVLPSQSLHALHFLKVAGELLPKPNRFDAYYHANLFEGKALLRTAIQWHQFDEDVLAAVRGETEADTVRTASAHLSYLALHGLILLEKDPILKFKYQKLFEAQARPMRQDSNPMIEAMEAQVGLSTPQLGLAWETLARYPADRRGRGPAYWKENRRMLLAAFGGESNGQARDPVPVDWRPRDAFLWQRSARSIIGDQKDWFYPPLDYLFAYWLATNAASFEAVSEKS